MGRAAKKRNAKKRKVELENYLEKVTQEQQGICPAVSTEYDEWNLSAPTRSACQDTYTLQNFEYTRFKS